MNLAVIPARGGSKRIEKKNLRPFCGRPIIEYSIECALATQLFDHVIVSTDCNEIAKTARAAGADVPFVRPAELADDHTPTIPVVRHAIDWVESNRGSVELVCCLYATAPMVQIDDLVSGFNVLTSHEQADFAFSVAKFSVPIFRALKIDAGRTAMFWPEHELSRSQDLPDAYHDAGQFYWGRANSFRTHDRFFSADSIPVILPSERVQDIDTIDDWNRAECIYKEWQRQICNRAHEKTAC